MDGERISDGRGDCRSVGIRSWRILIAVLSEERG